MKKLPSKVAHNRPNLFFQYCQLAQNQPKCHFLFHKNPSLRDFYILTLAVPYDFFQNNSNVRTLFGIKLRGAHLKIYLRAIFMKQPNIITYINIIIERKLIVDASRNGILLPKLFWPTVRKIVLVIEKNFWNSRLKAENLQKFWDHLNNLFKQWKVGTIFGNRMLF